MQPANDKGDTVKKEIDLVHNQEVFKTFNFYLLKMRSHLDLDPKLKKEESLRLVQNDEQDEKVDIVYQFEYDIMVDLSQEDVEAFGWDVEKKPCQMIFVSADTNKLLEVINNQVAIVSERRDIDDSFGSDIPRIEWEKKQIIRRFHRALQGQIESNFIFSPNFNFHFDFDFAEN